MNLTRKGEAGPRAILISQQQMYRAGNQVLFRTIEGYLRGGFSLVVILPVSDDPQLANEAELFSAFSGRIQIVRVAVPGSRVASIGKRLLGRRRDAETAREPIFPDPRVSLPFQPSRRFLSLFTLAAFTFAACRAALRVARVQRPVLMIGFELMATPAAYIVARVKRLRVVGHYQGTFLCTELGKGRAAYFRQTVDFIGTALPLDRYFMLNDGTRGDQVLRELGVPGSRVAFRISGVELGDAVQQPFDLPGFLAARGAHLPRDAATVVSLARLGGWKRVERVIMAFPKVVASCPNVHLLIAHRGPMRARLEALAVSLGVSHRTHFIGALSHAEVTGLLASCDVFVSTNDHSNLSNPLLEAMAAGCAIVTLDDGSTDGLIVDGENGVLVDPHTLPQSLAEALTAVLSDSVKRLRLGSAARETARALFVSWPRRLEMEVAEVQRILQGENGVVLEPSVEA